MQNGTGGRGQTRGPLELPQPSVGGRSTVLGSPGALTPPAGGRAVLQESALWAEGWPAGGAQHRVELPARTPLLVQGPGGACRGLTVKGAQRLQVLAQLGGDRQGLLHFQVGLPERTNWMRSRSPSQASGAPTAPFRQPGGLLSLLCSTAAALAPWLGWGWARSCSCLRGQGTALSSPPFLPPPPEWLAGRVSPGCSPQPPLAPSAATAPAGLLARHTHPSSSAVSM